MATLKELLMDEEIEDLKKRNIPLLLKIDTDIRFLTLNELKHLGFYLNYKMLPGSIGNIRTTSMIAIAILTDRAIKTKNPIF